MFTRAFVHRHSAGSRIGSGCGSGSGSEAALCAFQLQTRSYYFLPSSSTAFRARLHSSISLQQPLPKAQPHAQSHASSILPRRPLDRTCAVRSFSNCNRSASSRVAAAPSPPTTTRNTLKSRGQNLRFCRSSSRPLTPTSDATSSSLFSTSHTSQSRPFSSTSSAMTATKIDGTAIAKKIRERLHAEIESTQKINPRYKPSLKIIQGMSGLQTFAKGEGC